MMKLTLMTLIFAALLAGAGKLPAGVPEGATELSPGVYRFVDKEKKTWVYRPTPFGYMRTAESDKAEAPAADSSQERRNRRTTTPFGESKATGSAPVTQATEDGDSIRFERDTPFGPVRWTRKKTELNADETRIWETQRTRAASQGADNSK